MCSGHFYPDTWSLLILLHTSVTTSESTLTQESQVIRVMSLPALLQNGGGGGQSGGGGEEERGMVGGKGEEEKA